MPRADSGLPPGSPLAGDGPHLLNPDTCAVLPIVFGLIEPESPIARATLSSVERLWNQAWTDGGYGRYDVSSEPDSPGAWPFASVFVARACVETGDSARVWRVLRWLARTAGAPSGAWFEFNGPRLAPPFPQVGIIPWLTPRRIAAMSQTSDRNLHAPHLLRRREFLGTRRGSGLGRTGPRAAGGRRGKSGGQGRGGAHPWVYAATQPNYDITPVLPAIFADMQYAGLDGIELMHTALRPDDAVERIGELSARSTTCR